MALPRSSRSAHVSVLPAARDTTSQREASCWKARIPIAFSPSVRLSPTLADSKRFRATSRNRSGLMPRPLSSMAIIGYRLLRLSTTLMRPPRLASTYSSAALDTNSLQRVLRVLVGLTTDEDGFGQIADPEANSFRWHDGDCTAKGS